MLKFSFARAISVLVATEFGRTKAINGTQGSYRGNEAMAMGLVKV